MRNLEGSCTLAGVTSRRARQLAMFLFVLLRRLLLVFSLPQLLLPGSCVLFILLFVDEIAHKPYNLIFFSNDESGVLSTQQVEEG